MRRSPLALIVTLAIALSLLSAAPASAQFGKLKDKVKQKVEKKVDQKTDQAIDKTIDDATTSGKASKDEAPATDAPEDGAAPAAGGAAPAAGGTAVAEDMTLYTKYDFVPGDKVIFYDDLAHEEMGEFPSRWNLDRGVFEIATVDKRNWILCTDRGKISPRIKAEPLPDKYTVEMDFASALDQDGWYSIHWVDAKGNSIGYVTIGYSYMTEVHLLDKTVAGKDLEKLPVGRHVMRIMATKSTIKCYIDQQRIANVPKVEGFEPVGFEVEMNPYFEHTQVNRIGTFRYAEGGKSMREQLDEAGRIVTHGILFDSGSDRIKAESVKTLNDIGAMLAEDAALRLSIEGHTDADGADADNLKLSQARAASVRTWLMDNFKVDGGRLETKGLGETKPIDVNTSPEGKANNRRVELVKL